MNKNKVFLVTGALSPIGRAICNAILERGALVAINYRGEKHCAMEFRDSIMEAYGIEILLLKYDLLDYSAPEKIVNEIMGTYGRLDGIVNNASTFQRNDFSDINISDWHNASAINLHAPFFLAQKAYHILKNNCGSIVNISDISTHVTLAEYIPYCVSKSALNTLTKVLAKALAPEVRVNTVSPGIITLPSDKELFSETHMRSVIERTALKRVGDLTDIASAVAYLLFDAPYVTGHNLVVDGGRMLY
jgi:pteridine reductase